MPAFRIPDPPDRKAADRINAEAATAEAREWAQSQPPLDAEACRQIAALFRGIRDARKREAG